MKNRTSLPSRTSAWVALGLTLAMPAVTWSAQPAAPGADTTPLNWTTQQDHQNMKDQLGIKALRPGPSGREGATNSANYDVTKANPFPNLPEALTLKNGQKVTTADQWWKQRRPEIVEDFEREVLGRVPRNVPKVTWTIATQATDRVVGAIPVNARQLIGQVDNSGSPSIEVKIQMTLVTPKEAKGRVPVLMMFGGFGGSGFPRRAGEPAPTNRFGGFGGFGAGTNADPPSTEQLIAAGWGYATINPASIQADNGAGLTKGVIGLVNKGQPRKPDDWGSLRAWAWGAARGLDYLETDSSVDAKKVGIEGVSRYGKAALVTLALEPRFAMALVGSSGEGGAKLHRRNFGEAVENLTGSGEYHWMAGNFLKYGAAESSFGSKNAGDLPVDAHELIALCAPRPTFISYGIPERGDAKWLDQQGSYMATVAAGPVFRLLGARDVGDQDDYRVARMPPMNTGLLEGELAWRQHDGGHEDRSNMKHFIAWANKWIKNWPFDATEAVRRQTETSQMTKQPVILKITLGGKDGPALNWRLIPAGKFIIGSPATENGHEGDERQRPETISEPFYMMETQLTVEQYRALMQAEPSDAGDGSDPKVPAGILFRDTVDKVLPALAKLAPAGWKVILPDHARLEYAARAGVATMNPGGDKPEDAAPFAWTRENSEKKVHPVARKLPNAWGLYDVIGNRWHWFWRAGAGYGNDSTKDHIVYGGTYRSESGGNGARLANIMISDKPEGARFALIPADAPVPKGHPETRPPR